MVVTAFAPASSPALARFHRPEWGVEVGGDDEEELDEVDEAEAAASSLSRRFNDSFPFCPSQQRSRLMLLHYFW